MKKLIIFSLLAFFLVGCTSNGPKYMGMWDTSSKHGDLVVYRESEFYAVGTNMRIMENGRILGTVRNGSYAIITVNPGNHTIHFEPDRPKLFDSLGFSAAGSTDLNLIINPREKKFFKLVLKEQRLTSGFLIPEMVVDILKRTQKEAELELVGLNQNNS